MRVVSGKYKATKLDYLVDGTRATQDRVKESTFATIKPILEDTSFLDLFSGTGSIGIEALSNGAAFVYFNDINRKAIEVIKRNLAKINANNYKIFNMDYLDLINHFKEKNIKVDIAYLDPPYAFDIETIISNLIESNIVNDNGLIIVETSKRIESRYIFRKKRYGNKYIYYLTLNFNC